MASPTNANYTPDKLRAIAKDAASRYGLNFDIFDKQLMQESGYKAFEDNGLPLRTHVLDANGKPASDATGVAQITSDTAKEWKVDPTDPIASIYAAAENLAKYQKYFTDQQIKPEVAQRLAVAAYHDGLQGVIDAIKSQGGGVIGVARVADGHGLTSEGAGYVSDIFNGKPAAPQSAADYTKQAKAALGIKDATTSGGYSGGGSRSASTPPDPNDPSYNIQQPDGTKQFDGTTFYKDYYEWANAQKVQQEVSTGPKAQYFDDTIKELTAEIAAGNLSVAKANLELNTRMDTFKQVTDAAPKLAEYAVPAGSKYVPQWGPGEWFSSLPGLKPLEANTVPVDLFGQALAINNRASSLASGINVPSTGQSQAALGATAGAPPLAAPAAPQGGDMFNQALARIQATATTGQEQQMTPGGQ